MIEDNKNTEKYAQAPDHLDLLTIGDASIDLYMKVEGKEVSEDRDPEHPRICFYHGSKIPVKSIKSNIAGNAINVALGVKNMGLETAVYAEMGADENADRIEKELKQHGIYTHLLSKNEGSQTGLHPVIVYAGERTIFSHHETRSYSIKKITDYTKKCSTPKWIYYTSISPGFEKFQAELAKCLKKHPKIGVAFNPGTYHLRAGVDELVNILEVTHVLFVNLEEAERLTKKTQHPAGSREPADLAELHNNLQKLGPKVTIITDGKNGASGYDGKTLVKIPAYELDTPIQDKTGAGDSFAAGAMAALNYNKNLKTALIWGAINSSFVIREVGAIHGLKTKAEMEKLTERFEKTLK
ncbi:MAG: carbohydrate kinase family protein [Paludibacteraceae bacterium]|nr:carbohydrate kinase family protein [Paludibacteraceae bacterium]